MIAAESHTPLERVRKKLEETFGQFDLVQTPEPHVGATRRSFVSTFSEAIRERRLVEIEYQKEGEETSSTRVVEPYSLERELPNWRVHTWDRTRDGERSFRLDRMRSATLLDETFDPREGFEPSRLRDARTAKVLVHEAGRALGAASAARARSSTARRSRSCPSAVPSGSRARSSRTAARPSSSSPTTSAAHPRPREAAREPSSASTAFGFRPSGLASTGSERVKVEPSPENRPDLDASRRVLRRSSAR